MLRDYQVKTIDETRQAMREGHRAVLVCSPTGSGKTRLTAEMLSTAATRGMSSLFLCHRRELILQTSLAFRDLNIGHGVIAGSFPFSARPMVQIGSVQTVKNKLGRIREPRLIVFDECHHLAAGTWTKIYEYYPDAFVIGLTATPERLDGTGLIKYFSKIVYGPPAQELIDRGYLSKYKIFAPKSVDISKIHTRMGDFVQSELSAAIDKPTITGDAIKEYQRLAPGKRAIVRGVSIEHSKHIAEQFNKAGIPALHVDGTTVTTSRDHAMASFRAGNTLILTNVDLFGEGLDVPAVECVIDLRPTKSLTLWLQFCGRALRPHPGKEHAIIIDHAGNVMRHGLPCDRREWSLHGRDKKQKDTGPMIRLCPQCFGANAAWRKECLYCQWVFIPMAREVEKVDGELEEVDIEKARRVRLKEQGRAKTYEELVELGKSRGYKSPQGWARHVIKNRPKDDDWKVTVMDAARLSAQQNNEKLKKKEIAW